MPSSVYHRVSDNPKMTKRRKGLLDFIRAFQESHGGMPPSIREIGEAVGLASSSTVHCHLQALVKMGELEHDRSKPRSYRLAGVRRSTVAELEAEVAALEAELEQAYQAGRTDQRYGYASESWAEHKRLCVASSQSFPQAASGVDRA